MAHLWGETEKRMEGRSLMFDVDSLEGEKQKGIQQC